MPSRPVKENPPGYAIQYEALDDLNAEIDPEDPVLILKWPRGTRIYQTVEYALATFYVSLYGSGCFYDVLDFNTRQGLGINEAIPSLSWFLIGTSVGYIWVEPCAWSLGPRFPTLGFLMVLHTPRKFLEYIAPGWLLAPQFLYGLVYAGPLVFGARGMAQMWPAEYRPAILALHSLLVVVGSLLSPIIGTLLVSTNLTIPVTFAFLVLVLAIRTGVPHKEMIYGAQLHEVYARVGKYTAGDWPIAAYRLGSGIARYKNFMMRYFDTLKTPATLMLLGSVSFVYGIMYLLMASVGENYEAMGFELRLAYMPLIATMFGYIIGLLVCLRYVYTKVPQKLDNAETQLVPLMMMGWTLPIGCFVYGWTIKQSLWTATFGLFLIGVGIGVVFQTSVDYLDKVYGMYSASLVGSSTFLNGIFGSIMTLMVYYFNGQMSVGSMWNLVGRLAILVALVPFILNYRPGRKLTIGPEMEINPEKLAAYLYM